MAGSEKRDSRSGKVVWAVLPRLVRALGRIAWRLEIDLGDGFPEPPFVIASNHHSFLDALLIGGALDEKIRFLALLDLFGNYRWVDFFLRAFDVIPLERGVVPLGPVRAALGHLSEGGIVGLFPEGTRHPEFRPDLALPGAAWLAIRAAVPLVPVALKGTDRVLGVDNRLHPGRISLTVGPSLRSRGSGRASVDDLTARWGLWVSETLLSERK